MLDQFFLQVGQEGLKTLPLVPALWLIVLVVAIAVLVKVLQDGDITQAPDGEVLTDQRIFASSAVALIVASPFFGGRVWDETKEWCQDLRDTPDQWRAEKCGTVDPGGVPPIEYPDFLKR